MTKTHLYLRLKHRFTLDYKETTVNPLSDKVVSRACVCVKIFVSEVCDCDKKCWQGVSLRCLCPCGLYRI